jgi:hypothetical protein
MDNPLGLIGGFLQAFLISLANVTVSFLAGWLCLRQLNHKSSARKAMGVIGFLFISVFVVFLHLATAHYREALQHSGDADFFSSLEFNPATLQDMQSLILIIIGGVITVIAMYKGYTADDPCPGYGKVYRKWKALNDQVSEAMLDFKLMVSDEYSRAIQKVDAIPADLDTQEKVLKDFEADISTDLACVNSYYSQAQGAAYALITEYRGAIEEIWKVPGCFPVTCELIGPVLQCLDTAKLNEIHDKLKKQLKNQKKSQKVTYETNREATVKDLGEIRKEKEDVETLKQSYVRPSINDGQPKNQGSQDNSRETADKAEVR